jgi:hypothetical protein
MVVERAGQNYSHPRGPAIDHGQYPRLWMTILWRRHPYRCHWALLWLSDPDGPPDDQVWGVLSKVNVHTVPSARASPVALMPASVKLWQKVRPVAHVLVS